MLRGCAGIGIFGHNCGRREHRDAGLAHPDDMRPRTQHLKKGYDVFDKVVKVEAAVPQTDIASVVPVGEVDVVIDKKCLRGTAQ